MISLSTSLSVQHIQPLHTKLSNHRNQCLPSATEYAIYLFLDPSSIHLPTSSDSAIPSKVGHFSRTLYISKLEDTAGTRKEHTAIRAPQRTPKAVSSLPVSRPTQISDLQARKAMLLRPLYHTLQPRYGTRGRRSQLSTSQRWQRWRAAAPPPQPWNYTEKETALICFVRDGRGYRFDTTVTEVSRINNDEFTAILRSSTQPRVSC